MTANEKHKKASEGSSRSAENWTHSHKFRRFFEGCGKFGGDREGILRARVGSGDERKLQRGDFAGAAAAGNYVDGIG